MRTQKKKTPNTIDATNYIPVICNDPFHPGSLTTVYIDPNSVTSAQYLGESEKGSVVRLFYNNGLAEDVYDVYNSFVQR